jgi:hypothetical protein
MNYQSTAQFDATTDTPLYVGHKNISNVTVFNLSSIEDTPIEEENYTVNNVNGTVTLTTPVNGTHILVVFNHDDAPPPPPEPINVGGDAEDDTDRTKVQTAVNILKTYVNNTSPTQAQTVAVIKVLCKLFLAIIKRTYG